MNIDSIIAEWTYRLEKGYPDCPEDYIELRNVLREQTDLSVNEQDAIVRRAMGLEEQEDDEIVTRTKTEQQQLITYIETNYKFNDQSIDNLDFLSEMLEQNYKGKLTNSRVIRVIVKKIMDDLGLAKNKINKENNERRS